MSWLWFIPILLVMVTIHEMGHFLTARLFGMKVHEFGIGFPPKVWSKKMKDGMEWSINLLPIGGFVRIEGENGDSTDPNSFGAKPPWQRMIVLAAGPFMNLVLAFVLYLLLATGGKDVPNGPVVLTRVEPSSPAAVAGLQVGDLIVAINGNTVTSTRDVSIETQLKKSQLQEFTIKRGDQVFTRSIQPRRTPPEGEGPVGFTMGNYFQQLKLADGNTSLGLRKDDVVLALDGKPVTDIIQFLGYFKTTDKISVDVTVQRVVDGKTTTQVVAMPLKLYAGWVYKGSEAAQQGMANDSVILTVNGQKIGSEVEYRNIMQANQNKQVTLTFLDAKTKTEKTATIFANLTDNVAAEDRSPRAETVLDGLLINRFTHKDLGPLDWVTEAWNQTTYAITLIPRSIEALVNGSVGFESFAGPVGMAQITNTVVENGGLVGTLSLMALLSVNLGIINILPLPALDGGRLVFVLIELVFRRRVPSEKEGLVHFAGMMLLLTMMVAFTWQDISRLITGTGF